MRNAILLLIFTTLFLSCEKEVIKVTEPIPSTNLSFKPIAGGAIMYYDLSVDDEARGIRIDYTDAQGNELTRVASYLSDSLQIIGFDKAQERVEATVRMTYKDETLSAPTKVTFKTEDSGAYAFFDNARIAPYWNGFSLVYDAPENTRGLAHVYYIGINPNTQKKDTLRLETFAIEEGVDTLNFILKQKSLSNTVVVRTEDYRGHKVKEQVWEDVEVYDSEYLESSNFDFFSPDGLILEEEEHRLSASYLFDKDVKGYEVFKRSEQALFWTFVAGPYAIGKPFVIDFKDQPRIPAYIKIHSMLNVNNYGSDTQHPWNGYALYTRTPCSMSIYVSNDLNDENSWKFIGDFNEASTTRNEDRWSYRGPGYGIEHDIKNMEQLDAADPCFFTIHFPPAEETYRYLKIVVNDTFEKWTQNHDNNPFQYISFHEIELFVKKN